MDEALERIFPLEGGWLALGFCNTVGWHAGAYKRQPLQRRAVAREDAAVDGAGGGEPAAVAVDAGTGQAWQFAPDTTKGAFERFTTYRALVGWYLRNRQLTVRETKRLLREARRQPEEAEAVRQRAIALRESIYHILAAAAGGDDPTPGDVAAFNAWLPESFARRQLAYDGEHFSWEPRPAAGGDSVRLDSMLWPVVWSATELLTSDVLARVRECANDPCGWLFVDQSRNRSRRWCDMQDCGNRVKARRHYQRVKQAAQRSP